MLWRRDHFCRCREHNHVCVSHSRSLYRLSCPECAPHLKAKMEIERISGLSLILLSRQRTLPRYSAAVLTFLPLQQQEDILNCVLHGSPHLSVFIWILYESTELIFLKLMTFGNAYGYELTAYISTTPWRRMEEWMYRSTFPDLDTCWRWQVSFTPLLLYPVERSRGTHWIWGWVDPRAGLDSIEKWKFLTLPGLELLPLGSPARSQSLYRVRYRGSPTFISS
jgi:hypothetical protein